MYFLLWKNQNIENTNRVITKTGKNNPKNEIGQNTFGFIKGEIKEKNIPNSANELIKKIV